MDSYLESLTKKSESTIEEVTETEEVAEAVEETLADEPEVASEVEDAVAEESAEETATEEDKEQEVGAEEQAVEAEPEEAESAEEVEEASEEEPNDEPVLQAPDVPEGNHKVGELINVVGIRVFNTPSLGQPFKIISGNVTYDGKVEGFTIIEYMKSGFGMVKGYTPDLK